VPTTADVPWKAVAQRVTLQLRIIDPPTISDIVMRCVADEFEIKAGGAIALKLGMPAVLVRRAPKTYFVSYGDNPAVGDGRLVGERLPHGTPIHLVDDLVFAGRTVRSAREALNLVGLDGTTASAILWTYRADAAKDELAAAGMTEITCLTHQSLIPG
jgi:adenine/guanine phosphoribosyltransferase-like PRPP-binding protein